MVRKLLLISAIGAVVAAGIWIDLAMRGPKRARFTEYSSSGQAFTGCVDFRNAASQVGRNGCVTGDVLRAYTSKSGNTFLDFCQDYRSCPFSSVIFSSDRPKFGDLTALEGRVVEIRGYIKTYAGRAEIVVSDPQQIRVPRE
jgi:hypothetical protein